MSFSLQEATKHPGQLQLATWGYVELHGITRGHGGPQAVGQTSRILENYSFWWGQQGPGGHKDPQVA
jgi:hypothetical protein